MSIYKNQAMRVYHHIKSKLEFDDTTLQKILHITPQGIEANIQKSVQRSKLNGKKVADLMIKMFDQDSARIQKMPEHP